ncbi:ArsR/SmtB family transcription factor [Streptomyces sp. NPDC021093]|uniref:ArsR/SmtB family transcription factor n=1 Tax=Streptomyces sp. NPDC021093 TaxID=3365112 RepID=UPI0037A90C45
MPEDDVPLDGQDHQTHQELQELQSEALGRQASARKVQYLDARTLRGLAHPLRIQLLRALRDFGPATASQLGERLGESSGATSYHLRQLATYGFVEDAPECGKGRERWWQSTHQGTHYDGSLADSPDPTLRGASDLFMHEVANTHTRDLSTWLGTSRDWSEEWRKTSTLSDYTLPLTPEQASELSSRIGDLIESYRPKGKDKGAGGSEKFRFHLHGFPLPKD